MSHRGAVSGWIGSDGMGRKSLMLEMKGWKWGQMEDYLRSLDTMKTVFQDLHFDNNGEGGECVRNSEGGIDNLKRMRQRKQLIRSRKVLLGLLCRSFI